MTSAVAARVSIRDRGLLRKGYRADIVVFVPATVADRAVRGPGYAATTGR